MLHRRTIVFNSSDPANATVTPNSKTPITLTITPYEQLVFNVKCKVSSSSKPLQLNVKAEGFSMSTNLYCEDPNGGKVEFTSAAINEIHLGEVEKNEVTYRNLFTSKSGKYGIDGEWFLDSSFEDSLTCYTTEPQKFHVEPGEKFQSVLC